MQDISVSKVKASAMPCSGSDAENIDGNMAVAREPCLGRLPVDWDQHEQNSATSIFAALRRSGRPLYLIVEGWAAASWAGARAQGGVEN